MVKKQLKQSNSRIRRQRQKGQKHGLAFSVFKQLCGKLLSKRGIDVLIGCPLLQKQQP